MNIHILIIYMVRFILVQRSPHVVAPNLWVPRSENKGFERKFNGNIKHFTSHTYGILVFKLNFSYA